MDRLSIFFSHFTLSAKIFLAGTLCGTSSDHATETAGHLHLLRRGKLTVCEAGEAAVEVEGPCVLLYIRPGEHIFHSGGADIVCAFVEFGAGMLNPLASALAAASLRHRYTCDARRHTNRSCRSPPLESACGFPTGAREGLDTGGISTRRWNVAGTLRSSFPAHSGPDAL
jgi:hypothetical protein